MNKEKLVKDNLSDTTIIEVYAFYCTDYCCNVPMSYETLYDIKTHDFWYYTEETKNKIKMELEELKKTDTKDTYYYFAPYEPSETIHKIKGTKKAVEYCLKTGGEDFIEFLIDEFTLKTE